MKKTLTALLCSTPLTVVAVNKPSMTSMWLELLFVILVMISLKIATFSNSHKFIIFGGYILSGIITQTLWFPLILWLALFYYFSKTTSED